MPRLRRLIDQFSLIACLFILLAFVYAGLKPFHAPDNGIRWLGSENGLRIFGDGVALTDRSLSSHRNGNEGCSVEILIHPARNRGSSTILGFYEADPQRQFTIRQNGNSQLGLINNSLAKFHVLEFEHIFFPGVRTLVTVASGGEGTALYLDGSAVKTSKDFILSSQDCSGQLVLGAAAVSYDDWNGDVFGVGIYHSRLTESQVRKHYDAWNSREPLKMDPAENPVALYTFREQSGTIVHNSVSENPDLHIPTHFHIPGHTFLESPWNEFGSSGINWKDISINIGGFVPFGFFLVSYLRAMRRTRYAALVTIAAGTLVSFTIEVLQFFLPTRDSSLTDVLTNGLGTAVGVVAYWVLFGKTNETSGRPSV